MREPWTTWGETPRPPAAAARLVVAAVAGLVGAFALLQADAFTAMDLELTAATYVAVTLPYVLLLGGIAVVPRLVQRLLTRVSKVRLWRRGHVAALVLLATTLLIVFGQGSLVPFVHELESALMEGRDTTTLPLDEGALLIGLAFNLIIFLTPVIAWLIFIERAHDPWRALGLKREGNGRAVLEGIGLALLGMLGIIVIGAILLGLGVDVPENERALEIGAALSLPGAIALAVIASISEETFFRAYLQPRIGVWAQAVLFSLAHLSYVNVMEMVATFLLGLLFGYGYRSSGNLVSPLVGHFTFNLVMLILIRAPLPGLTG